MSTTTAGGGGSGDADFFLYTSGGTSIERALGAVSNVGTHELLDPWLHPAGDNNWQGLAHILGGAPSQVFHTWGPGGGTVSQTVREAVSTAPTVDDGSVVLDFDFTPGNPPTLGPTNIEWFNSIGISLRSVAAGGIPDMVLQAFGTRHVLTLQTPASPWRARWYDENGVPLTDSFPVPGTPHAGIDPWFKLLLDGRVAINDGATWAAVLPDGQAHNDPVPDWLSSRPNTRIATIRQGSGYAVMPLLFSGSSKFEILTPDGSSCGAFNTPAPSPPNGETWGPESLNVGYDGTLLEVDNAHGGDLDVSIHCVYRWWPALLK
ncbi:MAG TPA: hypothetical protein VF400_14030 [Anaeromyxobacteraceae bacterium]